MPFERHVQTVYVPEDYIARVVERAAAGNLFTDRAHIPAAVIRQRRNYARIQLLDDEDARRLHFNVVEVWRLDRQSIAFRVGHAPVRGKRLRALRRNSPGLPFMIAMVPVFSILAFIAPTIMLAPVIRVPTLDLERAPQLQPLGKRLKDIADGRG